MAFWRSLASIGCDPRLSTRLDSAGAATRLVAGALTARDEHYTAHRVTGTGECRFHHTLCRVQARDDLNGKLLLQDVGWFEAKGSAEYARQVRRVGETSRMAYVRE